MGKRGPKPVSPDELYFFAQEFYRDFRRLAEGRFRLIFDKPAFDRSIAELEKEPSWLSDEERARYRLVAERKVRRGLLKESQKQKWLRNQEINPGDLWIAAAEARKQLKIPGEPEVLEALLRAKNPERVRKICKDAHVLRRIEDEPGIFKEVEVQNWPIASGSMLPRYLSQYAEQFIAAKHDSRFPRASRPSNELKQIWFLSRALAGALFGVKTRTAINLVGSKRPEQIFQESRTARTVRKGTK